MRRLVWIGRYRGTSGFAIATRQYILALQKYTKNLCIAPLEVLEDNDPFIALQQPISDEDFRVVNHLPTTDPEAQAYLSVWEYDRIPEEWVDIFNRAQLILTQSRYCQQIFAKQIQHPGKIHLIPYILTDNFSPIGPKNRIYSTEFCVFGSIFEWIPRKTPELLIRSFIEEFSQNEPVRLVLRTNIPGVDLQKKIYSEYKDTRIRVIESPIGEIAAFYRGLDAYISCTAGEGFGQTMAEAMACGIPTIASRHGGQLDFMNDSNSWLVDVEDWSPALDMPGCRWKLPKVAKIRKAMREVYSLWINRSDSPRVSEGLNVRSQFNAIQVGERLWAILSPFLE